MLISLSIQIDDSNINISDYISDYNNIAFYLESMQLRKGLTHCSRAVFVVFKVEW